MKSRELLHILAAIIIFTAVGSLSFLTESNWKMLPEVFFYAAVIILTSVFTKKWMANLLDTDVEHEIFTHHM